ncbi:hypothetical protein [Streptomyces sp. NPDC001068]|uniref:hypothetical protein n=1 Tax=Streptomyces sp. NPDC001068 TaxID=3364544 RepID=UPI0036C28854
MRTRTVGVDVVRLTPLQHGRPVHATAETFTPRKPLHLMVAIVYLAETFPEPLVRCGPNRDVVAAIATEDAYEERHFTEAMDRRLLHHVADGVAVETWTAERGARPAPRRWLYNLLPRWTWTPPEDWPLEEPDSITVHTVGKVNANPLHTWPTPAPYERREDAADLHAVQLRTAITSTPPPAAGYADRPLATCPAGT